MPPDSLEFGMEEAAKAMMEGRSAMGILSMPFMDRLNNPKNSPHAGKFRIAPLPQGPGVTGDKYVSTGWGFAISKYSKDQDAALKLLRYLNGKFLNPGADAARAVLTSPGSEAAFNTPGVKQVFPDGQDQIVKHMLSQATTRPHLVAWNKVSTAIADAIQEVFLGKMSARDAVAKAEQQVNGILGG
jgi:trehalose/maltose transport system substrate-binding protein